MKYFTPQLYARFNSFDPDEEQLADEEWDRAEAAYKERLASFREQLPAEVAKLAAMLCLHDALVLSRTERVEPAASAGVFATPFPISLPLWSAAAILSVQREEEIVTLFYSLSDHVAVSPAPEDWRFSKLQEQWLYDEVDIQNDSRGPFVHRILLSTGVVLTIPFVSVIIHEVTVAGVARAAKQSA